MANSLNSIKGLFLNLRRRKLFFLANVIFVIKYQHFGNYYINCLNVLIILLIKSCNLQKNFIGLGIKILEKGILLIFLTTFSSSPLPTRLRIPLLLLPPLGFFPYNIWGGERTDGYNSYLAIPYLMIFSDLFDRFGCVPSGRNAENFFRPIYYLVLQ